MLLMVLTIYLSIATSRVDLIPDYSATMA